MDLDLREVMLWRVGLGAVLLVGAGAIAGLIGTASAEIVHLIMPPPFGMEEDGYPWIDARAFDSARECEAERERRIRAADDDARAAFSTAAPAKGPRDR